MLSLSDCSPSPTFLFFKMMSQCLKDRVIANTGLHLEWITKRQKWPLFWDNQCQKTSLPPDQQGLHQGTWFAKIGWHIRADICAQPSPPYGTSHQGACSVSLGAKERGMWVLVLSLALQVSVVRSLLCLAALCLTGVTNTFDLEPAFLLVGQYSQKAPRWPLTHLSFCQCFWVSAMQCNQPLSWKLLPECLLKRNLLAQGPHAKPTRFNSAPLSPLFGGHKGTSGSYPCHIGSKNNL